MTARQRGSSWMADFMFKGERYREPFDTQREAELWEEEARFKLSRGEEVPRPKNKRTETGAKLETLQEMFDHVKRTQWSGMASSRHLIKNGLDVIKVLGPATLITDIRKSDLDDAYASFEEGGLSIGTCNRKMAAISKLLTEAEANGVISRKPTIPHKGESEGRLRYIDVAEETLITGTFAKWGLGWLVDFTIFQIETGMRLSETIRFEWRDLAPDGKTLHIWVTKNKLSRSIKLSKRAQEAITRLRATRGNLAGPFVNESPYGTMRTMWDRMQDHLGPTFSDVTIHVMRHTCASRMCQMPGVNIQFVQKFLGHKNVKTTMRYAKLSPSSLDHCAAALDAYYEEGMTKMKQQLEGTSA